VRGFAFADAAAVLAVATVSGGHTVLKLGFATGVTLVGVIGLVAAGLIV
jgi:hypothetical protein